MDSVDPGESGLSSDMLMSIAMGGSTGGGATDYSRYSVRHSIHIGLAPADLRLEPANEEMAKGNYCNSGSLCIIKWPIPMIVSRKKTASHI